jgi:3D (Asp-Asp-Asp) domain-containing protein
MVISPFFLVKYAYLYFIDSKETVISEIALQVLAPYWFLSSQTRRFALLKKFTLPLVTFFVLVAILLFGAFFSATSPSGAKAASSSLTPVAVTFYSDQGTMADGQQTHLGACAALVTQFAFGTKIQLFSPQNLNQPQFSCTIEDTGVHICQNNIDVALPGQTQRAIQLGLQHMQIKVVGLDQQVATVAKANHAVSLGCAGGATH